MELVVKFRVLVGVEVIEERHNLFVLRTSLCEPFSADSGSGERGCRALHDGERLHTAQVLFLVDRGNAGPDVLLVHDDALGFETADRFPHGNDRHVEVRCELREHEPVSRQELARSDPLPNEDVRVL